MSAMLATSATVYKEGYQILCRSLSPTKISRVALALAHSHCHLCNSGKVI